MTLTTAPRRPAGRGPGRPRTAVRPVMPAPPLRTETLPLFDGIVDGGADSLGQARTVLLVHVSGTNGLCVGCLDLGQLGFAPYWHARSAALLLGVDVAAAGGPTSGLGSG